MEQDRRAEITQLQQQHSAATKQRDQQIKVLHDGKKSVQKQLEQVTRDLGKVTAQYLAVCKNVSIAAWTRQLKDDSGVVVRPLCQLGGLMCERS
jgi:hypothetical protein